MSAECGTLRKTDRHLSPSTGWQTPMQQDFLENNPVASLLTKVLKSPLSPHDSRDAEYEAWRDRFMRKRLDVGLWIGLIAFLSSSLLQVSNLLFRPEEFQPAWLRSQVSD